ncbi:ABC transporter permease [Bradyrhizobium sp. RT11b]|uniref:ABC transporter permease n=1 Tax=Bradyrhizobium sp. RT11b TaxID=3156332 RepID=UPI00339937EE
MKRLVDHAILALTALTVIAACAVIVLPLLYTILTSFDARRFIGAMPPPALSLQWYISFFNSQIFMDALRASLVVCFVAGVLATILGTLAALGLARLTGGSALAAGGLFSSPQLIPHVVLGFALLLVFARIGIDNAYARLVLAHTVITMPFVVRTVLASLYGIRPALSEAAMSLGATSGQVLKEITLPLAKTGIAVGFIFAVAFSLDDVSVAVFLTDPDVTTLPVALASSMKASFDPTIAAAAVVMVGIAAAIVATLEWLVGLDHLIGQGLYGAGSKGRFKRVTR